MLNVYGAHIRSPTTTTSPPPPICVHCVLEDVADVIVSYLFVCFSEIAVAYL